MAVLRACSQPGCKALVESGRCAAHQKARWQDQYAERTDASRIGHSDRRWRKARQLYLGEHPFCADPFKRHGAGHMVAAVVLDHIIPHRGDFDLCWDQANWQGLCKSCNDRKTAIDHGWSKPKPE